ncbi:hypothetical protein PG990_012264 [Apiospora arundinis]
MSSAAPMGTTTRIQITSRLRKILVSKALVSFDEPLLSTSLPCHLPRSSHSLVSYHSHKASADATPPSSQDSGSTSLSTSNRENRSNAPPPSSQSDDAATPDTASELHIFEDPPSPPPRGRGESPSTPRGVNPPLGGLARSPLAPITPRNSRPFAVGSAQSKGKKKKNKEKGKGKEIDVSADHPRTVRTAIENKSSRESNGDGTPCRGSLKHSMMSNLPQCNIYED